MSEMINGATRGVVDATQNGLSFVELLLVHFWMTLFGFQIEFSSTALSLQFKFQDNCLKWIYNHILTRFTKYVCTETKIFRNLISPISNLTYSQLEHFKKCFANKVNCKCKSLYCISLHGLYWLTSLTQPAHQIPTLLVQDPLDFQRM